MNLTEEQIYEKIANQELSDEEALDLLEKINTGESIQATEPKNNIYKKTFFYDEDILKDHKKYIVWDY